MDEPPPTELMGIYDLDPLACQRLQRLCDIAGGAELVITSTWRKSRTIPDLQDLFRQRGLTAKIIGRTPDLAHHADQFEDPWNRIGRGVEIQWWLRKYLGDEATCEAKFAIIDDDSDMGDLCGKLVQTRFATGLTDLEGDYVCKHLRETLMDSMAAGGKGRVLFKHDAWPLAAWWNRQGGPFGPGG